MAEKKDKVYTLKEKLQFKIPYKWKVQSYNGNKTKGSCVAYIDARDVMDLLDSAVTALGWQDSYRRDSVGRLICRIELKEGSEWVGKEDVGTASAQESEKGEFSDAFKRAAVKWGVGRFLYDLEIKWVDIKDKKPVDTNGNRIYDLTEHFNKKGGTQPKKTEPKDLGITPDNDVMARENKKKRTQKSISRTNH